MSTAFITGITGQDGSYLAEWLLEDQRYERVVGLVRRGAERPYPNLGGIIRHPGLTLLEGDLQDRGELEKVFASRRVDECYNLAAQSSVGRSFEDPATTFHTNLLGLVNLLEAIRSVSPATRCFQAASSAMYGRLADDPLSASNRFEPRSPYASSKLAAFWHAVNMRQAHGLYVCNGVAFNHESPRRSAEFVTQKIVLGAVAYRRWVQDGARGEPPVLKLGNLDAVRDWGHARDTVRGMWLMLQQDAPRDYILATGQGHAVRDFVELAYAHPAVDTAIRWAGEGTEETGQDAAGRTVIAVDPALYRPAEAAPLIGDARRARERLGWVAEHDLESLVDDMVGAAAVRADG